MARASAVWGARNPVPFPALPCPSQSNSEGRARENAVRLVRRCRGARSVRYRGAIAKMEVEVKLRLPDAAAHQRASELLSPFWKATHMQENVFFDGARAELGSRRVVLRLRFYGDDQRCVLNLKRQALIQAGVSRADAVEHDVDPAVGRACVAEPSRLAALPVDAESSSPIIGGVLRDFGCEQGFVCLGGFRNVRGVFGWRGLTLELDETRFDFGTQYEIECETGDPERVKPQIEAFLRDNGVPFSDSLQSKFAVFRSGKLPD